MRILVALFISVALHLATFFYLTYHKKDAPTVENQKLSKTHINYVKLLPNKQIETPKKIQRDKPIKEIFKEKITPPQNTPKIIELPKEVKTFELPPKIVQKDQPKVVEKTMSKPIAKEPIQEIKAPESKKIEENIDKITKSYLELYKDDFDSFPEETKVYLIKNLKDIGKITQRFLIYPYIAVQAKQSGINVVEFILHPNGKITEPKIIKSSKYYILDDNSVETINQAYRDYPRPDKPTIIRIYVKYELI
ncbi:MAG: TonB family protein [Arcobacteraceae bacterium]|jgi:protein TonB|nr:TonB family protein [Arcobacteraceae bacterium]